MEWVDDFMGFFRGVTQLPTKVPIHAILDPPTPKGNRSPAQTYWNQRSGLLQDEIWDREVKVLRFYLQTPGGRAMWQDTRSLFSASFSQFVDAELERLESPTTPAA